MIKVNCKDCRWFRQAPYEAKLTGCWHADHMKVTQKENFLDCLLYTSPSPRDKRQSRMPSSA